MEPFGIHPGLRTLPDRETRGRDRANDKEADAANYSCRPTK
jgi:hypothetical protein